MGCVPANSPNSDAAYLFSSVLNVWVCPKLDPLSDPVVAIIAPGDFFQEFTVLDVEHESFLDLVEEHYPPIFRVFIFKGNVYFLDRLDRKIDWRIDILFFEELTLF